MLPKLSGEQLIMGRTLIIPISALVMAKEDYGNVRMNRRSILMRGFSLSPAFVLPS